MSVTPTQGHPCAEQWEPIHTAPEGIEIMTKIDDARGVRNVQSLKRCGGLFFFPDGSMYIYYTPTHWRHLTAAERAGGRLLRC